MPKSADAQSPSAGGKSPCGLNDPEPELAREAGGEKQGAFRSQAARFAGGIISIPNVAQQRDPVSTLSAADWD